MFTPRAFVEHDLAWLDRLLARDPFVTLLTTGADGLPELTRLPVLYRRDGEHIELQGHWARANPQARHAGIAKVLVDGPHGYVSASWYPDKEAAARVPTWNYASAELRGHLQPFDDEDALATLVASLSDRFEASVGQHWRFEPERDDQRRQLRGIVGFRFRVEQAQVKLKLSQNHPDANREAVIAALERQPAPASRELAQWMRWHQSTG
ncbi:FMN-binding negative transcriptional regulator [Stenotrophomonas sp. NLF4-10]|uniref:FMN-binding negative transcriptional regulator n=1 Tax=Stenotrophomonas sp. NLF4-10 TaxID=2918754 RepID=UPI001EFA3987|nr:FMN-binding negative transcriptional regulator [Stenotrophomonas sp. NLF4-10]MCG8276608.1 FMN-binding negative transcriptional regulator [Stenotrophomonas sp. NLF4-10]